MPEKTDYSPVTEHAPEAEAKRERRTWTAFVWGVHAFWIYALVVAGIILLVIYLTGGFGEGGGDR
jgi:choline-glycine betaine transporter